MSATRLRGAVLAALAVAALAPPAFAQTLERALGEAYLGNPTLRAQRATLRATDEGVPLAQSGWRPKVTVDAEAGPVAADVENRNPRMQMTTPNAQSLTITQPLFQGFRTVAGVRQAEYLVLAGRATLQVTEQQVLLDALTAFVNVVRDQAVLELNRNNEQVLTRQLDAARDRFRVGEVTRTDVAQAESRLARATAQRITAEGQLQSSRANYLRVIGTLPGRLAKPDPRLDLPVTLEEAKGLAGTQNPTVVAAQFTERAAINEVDTIQGEMLPEVNLQGRVLRSETLDIPKSRTEGGSITATLTMPLYTSGSVEARVRAAKQRAGQRRIQIEEQRNLAVESATSSWETWISAKAAIESFKQQVAAATLALDGVTQENLVGSRTVLDVLDAEQEKLDAQVALVRAERDEIVARFQLHSAIGRLTARQLRLPVEYYDEVDHYNRVDMKPFGLDGYRGYDKATQQPDPPAKVAPDPAIRP